MSNNVPTPPSSVTTHTGDHTPDCPSWCQTHHFPFEETLPEPPEELAHIGARRVIAGRDGRDVEVQVMQTGLELEPTVFLTVERQDVLNVRSTVARRIGQALIAAADDIDDDARAHLEAAGIVVERTAGGGVTVRLTDDCTMTQSEREQFARLMQVSGAEILDDIRSRDDR